MASLAPHLETVPEPLGVEGLTLHRLITRMQSGLPIEPDGGSAKLVGRALDSFVEAQVHGTVELARDVEGLVADASFYGTGVGDWLLEVSSRYGFALRWHPGFTLQPQEFPEEFRGFATRRLAERVAVDGIVDAQHLGAGQNAFTTNPTDWEEFGFQSQTLTSFRRVWHVLVLSGRPASRWNDLAVE